jgi:diaminopimelate epimerase
VGKYLFDMGRVVKTEMTVETKSGVKNLKLFTEGEPAQVVAAQVDMGSAKLHPSDVPVDLPGDAVIGREIVLGGTAYEITCVGMGNPHAVYFHDDIEHFSLETVGPLFENDKIFPHRTNFEVAQLVKRNEIMMRVWERGAGETPASGTGACAVAVAAVEMGYADKDTDITVHQAGGTLIVRYTAETVYKTGEAVNIFVGAVAL